jgi:hypothetical protein
LGISIFTWTSQIMRQPQNPTSKNRPQGYRRFLLSIVVAVTLSALPGLPGCRSEKTTPWVPDLEETGFSYLEETARRIRESQQQAQQDLAEGRTDDARVSLQRAAEAAAVLVLYDIPITEVRQLVYDAGRLYALDRHQQAERKLDRAAGLMQQIGGSDGPTLLRESTEVFLLIKDLLLSMEVNPASVPEKFKSLGHKVNLMALKSGLVLSGAEFTSKTKSQRQGER